VTSHKSVHEYVGHLPDKSCNVLIKSFLPFHVFTYSFMDLAYFFSSLENKISSSKLVIAVCPFILFDK